MLRLSRWCRSSWAGSRTPKTILAPAWWFSVLKYYGASPCSCFICLLHILHEHIDESGRVTGIIDFEGTTIAPLWECALLPRWLQDIDDPESTYEGGSAKSRQILRARFLEKVDNECGKWCMNKGNLFNCFVIGCNCKLASGLQRIWRRGWTRGLLGQRIILALDFLKPNVTQ